MICPDFSAFLTLENRGLIEMRAAAVAFATDMQTGAKPRWLSLVGSSGAGKTMLAKLIHAEGRRFCDRSPYVTQNAHEWRLRRVIFGTWPRMAKKMRGGDFELTDDFRNAWLAIIDDVGAEHEAKSTFIAAELYDLLNARLGRWTVLTSNLSMEDIAEKVDGRIASRMRRDRSIIVEVKVQDFATRKLP